MPNQDENKFEDNCRGFEKYLIDAQPPPEAIVSKYQFAHFFIA